MLGWKEIPCREREFVLQPTGILRIVLTALYGARVPLCIMLVASCGQDASHHPFRLDEKDI